MKKPTPYLDLYNEWMKEGIVSPKFSDCTSGGLCTGIPGYLKSEYPWTIMKPIGNEHNDLYSCVYWAAGYKDDVFSGTDPYYVFTPLRQTIILLCAALNDEL